MKIVLRISDGVWGFSFDRWHSLRKNLLSLEGYQQFFFIMVPSFGLRSIGSMKSTLFASEMF